MESNRNPSKLLTITQKIQEGKELLQEKQGQLKNIKNYLTNLEYRKTQELNELEEYIQDSGVYQLEHFTRVYPSEKPFNTVDNKWYVVIWRGNSSDNWRIAKFDNNKNYRFSDSIDDRQIDIDTNNNKLWLYKNSLRINDGFYWGLAPIVLVWEKNKIKYVYRWDGVENPNIKGKTVYFFDLIK